MESLEFRLLRGADKTEIASLEQAFNKEICGINGSVPPLKGEVALAAYVNGDVTGYCAFQVERRKCKINDFYVRFGKRNNGYGSELLKKVIDIGKESGWHQIKVTPQKPRLLGRYDSADFYTSHGFRSYRCNGSYRLIIK